MALDLLVVDAFTDRPFGGNPAAVCFLDRERPDAWMQAVASEMALSETAFLLPRSEAWQLRWFTPSVEVDLCGHATVAASKALLATGRADLGQRLEFHTRVFGRLPADLLEDGRIRLSFPALPGEKVDLPSTVVTAMGMAPLESTRNRFDYVLRFADEHQVRALRPDFAALAAHDVEGFVVTAEADPGRPYQIVSRYFAPAIGIDEDPVTGAAHCGLAPFWSDRLGVDSFAAHQASARGGDLELRLVGDVVELTGAAVVISRGQLECDG